MKRITSYNIPLRCEIDCYGGEISHLKKGAWKYFLLCLTAHLFSHSQEAFNRQEEERRCRMAGLFSPFVCASQWVETASNFIL